MKEGLNIQANTFPEDSQCKLIAILEQFGVGKASEPETLKHLIMKSAEHHFFYTNI